MLVRQQRLDPRLAQHRDQELGRDLARLIQAIIDGVPGAQVKDRIAALEQRKTVQTREISDKNPVPVSLHPNMAELYSQAVGELRDALLCEDKRDQASAIVLDLIEYNELTPIELEGKKTFAVRLIGRLAGILGLATEAEGPLEEGDPAVRVAKVVAGA